MKALVSLILVLILCGCGKVSQMRNLSGEYIGHYGGATEELFLSDDGSIVQVLKKDGRILYENTARWEIDDRGIVFRNFTVGVRMNGLQSKKASEIELDPTPVRYAVCEVISMHRNIITIAPDTRYYWEKK